MIQLQFSNGNNVTLRFKNRNEELKKSQIVSYSMDSSGKWCILNGIATPDGKTINGYIELYSFERKQIQLIEGFAPCFSEVAIFDPNYKNNILACINKKSTEATPNLTIIEVGDPKPGTQKIKIRQPFQYPSESVNDFPVVSHISAKYGTLFIVTKNGNLNLFELFTGAHLYRTKLTNDVIFAACKHTPTDGMLCVNKRGTVLLVSINDNAIVDYIRNNCKQIPDYLNIAAKIVRYSASGAKSDLYFDQFNELINSGDYAGAAKCAVTAPNGALRTLETIQMLKSLPPAPGKQKPILQYFSALLASGKLNAVESVELVKAVLAQGKKNLVENWLRDGQIECSEELGEIIQTVDPQLALKVFMKSNKPDRIVQGMAEAGQFNEIVAYVRKNNLQTDFIPILTKILQTGDKEKAVEFGKLLCNRDSGSPLANLNAVFDTFIKFNCVQEATTVMILALEKNKSEDAQLQTMLFEVTLSYAPKIAEGIFQLNMFTYYDKQKIAKLCEQVDLLYYALINYSDIADIRRVIVNTQRLKKEQIIDFLGTLEPTNALVCMFDILKGATPTNPLNMQIVLDAAIKNKDKIPISELIKLFTVAKNDRGLYYFLGQTLNTTEDPEIYFKYIEAATKIGEMAEVERVIRETKFYDPVKVKDFLKQFRLPDPRCLIYLCDIHGFVEELTQYLFKNGFWRHIEVYLYKVNPKATPQVMAALLEMDCEENMLKPILYNIRNCPAGPLVAAFEKKNKLKALLTWLEARSNEGNNEVELHTALAKIYVDTGKEPQTFLLNNQFYDPKEVGKYCETRNPHFAYFAYKKAWGKCDPELIELCYKNQFFNLLAIYVVERKDGDLWKVVLDPNNEHRNKIVEQVVQSALPQSNNADDVAAAVKAFIAADLSDGLLELLDQVVLHHPEFTSNSNLQTLLIFTAIKSDPSRVMDYVNRLDNYDAPKLAVKALECDLKEEAFAIYSKANLHEEAIGIMVTNIGDLTRAEIYAVKCGDPKVWSRLATAELEANRVVEAINAFLKADDAESFVAVIIAAEKDQKYEELVNYLLMARTKKKEEQIDSELIYAYAQCNRLTELEDFISQAHSANIQFVGDRCFESKLYEAGKILFTNNGNNGRLASCLVHLRQFQAALDVAKKANTPRTWKEVNYACVRAREFRLAAVAGLKIIIHADHLDDVIEHYEKYGYWEELIKLLDQGLVAEETHNGIFTELGILLAKYMPERLMEHLKTHFQRLQVPKLLRACEEYQMWPEAVFLNSSYDQHDKAVMIMMEHSPNAWTHELFVASLQKAANADLQYRAIYFYLREQPMMLNDMLVAIANKLDLPKTVEVLKNTGYIALAQDFLKHVQTHNISAVNEALNDILLENGDHQGLRASVFEYDNCDQIKFAKRIEKHDLLEFRRIAALLYRKNKKYVESLTLSKLDELHKVNCLSFYIIGCY